MRRKVIALLLSVCMLALPLGGLRFAGKRKFGKYICCKREGNAGGRKCTGEREWGGREIDGALCVSFLNQGYE